jgi:hypothetical protein
MSQPSPEPWVALHTYIAALKMRCETRPTSGAVRRRYKSPRGGISWTDNTTSAKPGLPESRCAPRRRRTQAGRNPPLSRVNWRVTDCRTSPVIGHRPSSPV